MVREQSGKMNERVVVVTGSLAGSAVTTWSPVFSRAADAGPARLIIDLSACAEIDTSAIVVLLRVHRQMTRAGGRLVLRRPGTEVMRLLYVARVDHILQVEGPAVPRSEPRSPGP
jgi:anti-anti-sigma factor